ncbi:MAG: DUF6265 family protein [Pyrinomonadaceae bacterium]
MRFRLIVMLGVMPLLVFSLSIAAQEAKPDISSLSWLTGCWEMNNNGRVTTESWGRATKNLIIGTSQTVKDGKSVSFEFLRVVDNGHGMIYVAKPADAKTETAFMVSKTGDREVVFENLKHDFPQRIIYKLTKPDALFARIEGTTDGKLSGMDFPMTRAKCG